MKIVILSAGRGSRLQGLTAERPKCLLDLAGRSLLEWQVAALRAAGAGEIVVVTGFGASHVEDVVATLGEGVRTLHNPFFALADNLGSCWAARGEMAGDFAILNGDTIVEPALAHAVLAPPPVAPIAVSVDRKGSYDPDDMKVSLEGDRLRAVGKALPPETVNGESIGFLRFNAAGAKLFVGEVERLMKTEASLKLWYLSAVDRLAGAHHDAVGARFVDGLEWGELDFPDDLARARALAAGWLKRGLFG